MQTEGVREQPFFSQTAFLVGGFPQPLFCRSCRRTGSAPNPRDSIIKAQSFLPRKRPFSGRREAPISEGGCHEVTGGSKRAALLLPNRLSCGRVPTAPLLSLMPRRAHPFLAKRKGWKRFASLRGLTAKGSTQRNIVKRGLRLWKQQPKQSPPFSNLSPTHQQTAALQLIGLAPIRQIVPLLNEKEAT